MRLGWVIVIGMLAAGLFSSVLTAYFLKDQPSAVHANSEDRGRSPSDLGRSAKTFDALLVLDETRGTLNFDEQKALFAGFSRQLNDPASAQLRLLRRAKDRLTICGEVNAKNRLGGYVGFVPFAGVITGETAVITMPTREVAVTMPSEIAASFQRLGCSEPPAPAQASAPKADTPLGDANEFSGKITRANSAEFVSFIGANSGKLVRLSVSLRANEAGDLEVFGDEKAFHAFTRFSKINAASGFQYDKGAFNFDGTFFIEYLGIAEGASYELRKIQGGIMRSGIGLSK